MKTYVVPFKRVVCGYIEIIAENSWEARDKLERGDWNGEFENKSDYEYEDIEIREVRE